MRAARVATYVVVALVSALALCFDGYALYAVVTAQVGGLPLAQIAMAILATALAVWMDEWIIAQWRRERAHDVR
jgi:hypothetical protein